MEAIQIDGIFYYKSSDVAELWGLKEKTIQRYASPSSMKIKGCKRIDKTLFVPADAIRPITKPIAQSLIWGILLIKNDPNSFLDLTLYGLQNSQLSAVLDELQKQAYIDPVPEYEDERERLLKLRLTDKAIDLVKFRKRYKGNPLDADEVSAIIPLVFSAVQSLVQLACAR